MNIDVNNKYVPAFLAMIVALCITLMVRMILPSTDESLYTKTEELPLPEVPFTEKGIDRGNDAFVLITTKNINQWEKITSSDVTWKKWPREAISASFIAKDSKDNMLNDGGTYSSILNMLAKYPIVKGVPITMSVLARKKEIEKSEKVYTGPSEAQIRANVEKELREKFRQERRSARIKEEEQKRRLAELEKQNKVKPGTGIVTVQIDQRSAPPAYFLKVGDYVNLKFSNYSREGINSYRVFENLKVISINGSRDGNLSIGSVKNGVDVNVRSIVVEGSEGDISDIIGQLDKSQTAILVVKNQEDAQKEVTMKAQVSKSLIDKAMINNVILDTMANVSRPRERVMNSEEISRIINLNNIFAKTKKNRLTNEKKRENIVNNDNFLKNFLKLGSVVPSHNKTVSKNVSKNEIKIYRKFKETTVQFDKNGNVMEENLDKSL